MSSTTGSNGINAGRIRAITAAFGRFHEEFRRQQKAKPDERSPLRIEERKAALAALDLAAGNLWLLTSCRNAFGCRAEAQGMITELQEWAALTTTEKTEGLTDAAAPTCVDAYAMYWVSRVAAGEANDYVRELERWADEAERTDLSGATAAAGQQAPVGQAPSAGGRGNEGVNWLTFTESVKRIRSLNGIGYGIGSATFSDLFKEGNAWPKGLPKIKTRGERGRARRYWRRHVERFAAAWKKHKRATGR